MKTRDDLMAAAEDAVKLALAEGADAADVHVYQTESVSITASGRFVDPTERVDGGFSLRALVKGRIGVGGSTSASLTLQTIRAAIDSARKAGVAAPTFRFPIPPARVPSPIPTHPALERLDAERVSIAALRVSDAILAPKDVTYGETRLRCWRHEVALANSEGLRAYDRAVGEKLEFEMRLTRGTTDRSSTEVWTGAAPIETQLDIESYVARTAQRARDALDARPLEGGPVTQVVLTSVPTTQILGMLSNAFSGRGAASGISPFVGRLGQRVLSPTITLHDKPHGPLGANLRAMDDEGTPTAERALIRDGVLQEMLFDTQSAIEHGATASGNAVRAGATGMLSIKPHVLTLAPTNASLESLIEQADRAILVNEAMLGAFSANLITGDFSASVPFTFLIERGRVTQALPPTSIGGSAHSVFGNTLAVARDVHSGRGATSPSILAGGVSCAT